MIYVSSDMHGYPLDRFLKLLEKAGFGNGDELYILGDVIDRNGEGGVAMLRWIMRRPNVRMLMGNHEDMLLSCEFLFDEIAADEEPQFSDDEVRAYHQWARNGARPTVLSLLRLLQESPEELKVLFNFIRNLPLYATVSAGGKDFVLVHSGLGNFAPDRDLDDYEPDELFWTRPTPDVKYFPDRMTILGHTPTGYMFGEWGKIFRTETWIDIDTGAAGGGSPMLLRLDDMAEFYADPEVLRKAPAKKPAKKTVKKDGEKDKKE
ncbi:MAG: metallophosphoesterase [Clostridiales bacterium]|nr:metallophosphoesterase [Clostridiales bacterium]